MRIVVVMVCLMASQAWSEVQVTDAWVRLLPPGVSATSGYLRMTSDQDDALIAVSTEHAAMAEIHESSMQDGVMQMSQVSKLPIHAGETLVLEPGGLHLMLMGLKDNLKAGQAFPLVLEFEKAGRVEVAAKVR